MKDKKFFWIAYFVFNILFINFVNSLLNDLNISSKISLIINFAIIIIEIVIGIYLHKNYDFTLVVTKKEKEK